MPRLSTGVPGFDAMVQGGLPVGSSVVLQGPPGQEKLRFALTFLAEGLKSGGSGLVVTSSQSPDAVIAELRQLGVNLDSVTQESRLRVVDWYSWSEETVQDIEDRGIVIRSSIDLTNLGVALSRAIAGLTAGESRRAVIELLSPATSSYEVTQVYAFAQSAKRKFDRHQFTSLVLLEKEMHSGAQLTTLHQPFDGVIEIERTRSGDRIVRKIGVLHLKETAPDPTFRVLEISEAGMRVVQDTPKPAAPGSTARGSVLESQDERAQRLRLILQIATERLKLNPGDADALFAMAAAQATLDDAKGGLEALDRLAALDSAYPGLWVLKTKLHAKLGQSELAQKSRLRALQREPEAAKAIDATVPCPMCEAPVALDATSCANCGVKFTPTRTLEDELDDLGHAAIQEMVQEDFSAAKEAEKAVEKKPALPAPKPKSERALPPPGKPPEKVPSKKGLTNGLVLERRGSAKAGRTNGLKGRTNGLRGRTNGLTNGLGRTNGLTNVVGRTNGLTNGLGRTNGLTNGLGRTNGLTNGLGRTNGITNGLGRTNGLTNGLAGVRSSGFHPIGRRGMARSTGWKLYLIPMVAVSLLLLPLFLVPEYFGPSYPIQIDGQFNDWAAVATEATSAGTVPNPNVDVVRFGIANNLGPVAFYVRVAGSAFAGGGPAPGTMDTVRIFVDIDASAATGYRIDGLGADRMIEISGYGGTVLTSTLWEFDSNRDSRDWNGWIKGTPTPAAASGSQIEAQAEWLGQGSTPTPVIATVHTTSWDEQADSGDFPVSPNAGTLSVVTDPQVPDVVSGSGVPLLRLTLTAHGQAVTLNSVQVQVAGTAAPATALSLRLMNNGTVLDQVVPASRDVIFSMPSIQIGVGGLTTLSVVGDFSSTSGETFGLRLPASHPFGVGSGVVAVRENPGARMLGYLGVVPSTPQVDGAFDEWTALSPDSTNDVAPRANPNIDLAQYGGRHSGGSTFVYTSVAGQILHGTPVPEAPRQAPPQNSSGPADTDRDGVPDIVDPVPLDFNNDGIPDSQTNGDYDGDGITDYGFPGGTDYWLNTTIPSTFPAPYAGRSVSLYIGPTQKPPVFGEDVLRIFFDIDNSTWSGYSIGGIGADRLIEIRGKDHQVTQAALLGFSGSFPGQWAWTPVSPLTVAVGYHAVELLFPLNATNIYVEAGDFWGSVDSTTAVPAFSSQFSSFKVSSADTPLSVPWIQTGPQPSGTLIDGNSNAIATRYNHQREVVRAGDVVGQTACDATNSDGCWYVVFHDQVTAPDSAFKDGASVAIPTALGLLDSITTSLGTGDNLVIATVQISNTGGSTRTITAGNLQIRRGSLTTDPMISQTQFDIKTGISGGPVNGLFTVLLGKDASAPVNPTYGVFAFADSTGVNAEIKILVLNNIPATASGDGASVAVGTTETTLLSQSTTIPAGDNTVIASVQFDSTGANTLRALAGNVRLKRGATVLASNEFYFGVPQDTFRGDGGFALLIARDVGAPASPTYTVTALRDGTLGAGNGEAKLLAFNGVTSSVVDTGSVAISSTRTVIGTATTSFETGDDAIIGAIQLQNTNGAQETIAAAADDIRRTGDSLASSNTFSHALEASGSTNSRDIQYEFYVRKVSTSAANPSYEGAATDANAAVNGELKLVAIHIRDTNANGWDRVIIMRSADTAGSTWGSQLVLASGQSSDNPLLYSYDSSEPSIAIDSSGFLHVAWVSASSAGDQSTLNLVRYARTTVAYPTQGQLASAANWAFDETTSYYPGTETITTGASCGGTFPADLQSSNNVYRCLREGNTGGVPGDEIGAIGYKSTTGSGVNFPKQLDWTGSSWGTPETELASAGAAVENVRVVWDPTTDSTLFWIALNTGTSIHVYKCTNVDTCTKEDVDPSSGNDFATTQAVGTAPERHWDIAAEMVSGKLLLVYDNPAAVANDFCYRTRTAGSSGTWSAETCFDHTAIVSTNPSIAYITLASNPGTNRIAMGAFDTTNDDFVVAVWDGTTWVNADKAVSTTVTPTAGWGGTVVAEDSADEFVAYASNGADSIAECEWTSAGGWETTCSTFDPDSSNLQNTKVISAASLVGTNEAMVCENADDADIDCWEWDGVSGTAGTRVTLTELTTDDGSGTTIARPIGFDWNPDQTGTADLLFVYYAASSGSLSYRTYNDATNSLSGASTFTSAGSHRWVEVIGTRKAGDTVKAHVITSNNAFDILAYRWTGSGAPANSQTVTTGTVDETYPYWGFELQSSTSLPNYQLVVRHDWSGVPTDGTSYDVCVEAYIANAAGESMLLQVLTPPSTWNTRITVTKVADDNNDQCYTLTTAELNSGAPSVQWIGGTETGDATQSDINIDQERVIRHSVKIVDDANPGFMPTVSTDSSNNPHIAWSGSKTSGTVYYKNKAGGTWRATVSWGTTYTGLSVDVSPQNNYVSLARYFESATNEIQYTVCKDLSTSNCDASSEFTKWNGAAGFDTVASSVETGAYPSLVTTYEANGDLWIAYAKDVDGTTRAIYARFLDYPSNGFGVAETVDSLTGTQFTRPTIGVDKDGNVHALYVAISGPQLYYKLRTGGGWGSRTAVDSFSDHASLMARAPNDATYGTVSGATYWKSSTSETYFYYIPEFEEIAAPIAAVIVLIFLLSWKRRRDFETRHRGDAS